MAARSLLLAVVAGLGLLPARGPADDRAAAKPVASEKIQELIGQLGSTKYAERDRAKRELEALGMAALDALRQAAKSADAEVSRRATELVQKLEARLSSEAMLAPKRVRLQLKDTPVPDAVAELARQSGYDLQLVGDRTALAKRKITLDTGDTTFWEALDRVCRAAGLVESMRAANLVPSPFVVPGRLPQPALPPGILPVQPPLKPVAPKLFQVVPAQPQPGRVVVQLPAQIQPAPPAVPLRPILPGRLNRVPNVSNTSQILLAEGKAADRPTHYAGAVRLRIGQATSRGGEAVVTLDVAAEPRLQDFRIVGMPRIEKAIDEHDQPLKMVMESAGAQADPNVNLVMGNVLVLREAGERTTANRQVAIRFKLGDKQARMLTELTGSLSAQALSQTEPLITMDNILKAAGKSAQGKQGGSLQVHSVDKLANGDLQVKLTMENLPGQNPWGMMAGVIQVQGQGVIQIRNRVIIGGPQGAAGNRPKLLDAKGQPFTLVGAPEETHRFVNGQTTTASTLVFRAQAGQGDAAQLVLYGQRPITFQVPFTFKNVPLQ